MPHHHDIEDTHVFVGKLVLLQVGHALVLFLRDIAGRWLQCAAQDFHEGRLAGAVGADQAIAIALAEFDIDVLEQGFDPELHGDIGGDKHGDSDLRIGVKQAVKRRPEFYLFSRG